MGRLDPAVERLVRDPALTVLWAEARRRLERNGVLPRGVVTLDVTYPATRHAVTALLGSRATSGRVDLAVLDQALLASRGGVGLEGVLIALDGPVVDRRAVRANAAQPRVERVTGLDDAITAHGLDSCVYVGAWVEGLRRDGVLARAATVADVRTAVAVVARLEAFSGPVLRAQLAREQTGSAHGLDDARWVAKAVLRALAARFDRDLPHDAAGRRALWAQAGVLADDVSDTVLVYAQHAVSAFVAERSMVGLVTHLTWRDHQRSPLRVPAGSRVFVCENPSVVAAAADAGVAATVVCGFGQPTVLVMAVLRDLVAQGADVVYHGDFDWPGLAITNRVVRELGIGTWCMDSTTYEGGADSGPGEDLAGRMVVASWDSSLSDAMMRRGVSVEEEAILDVLVDVLHRGTATPQG